VRSVTQTFTRIFAVFDAGIRQYHKLGFEAPQSARPDFAEETEPQSWMNRLEKNRTTPRKLIFILNHNHTLPCPYRYPRPSPIGENPAGRILYTSQQSQVSQKCRPTRLHTTAGIVQFPLTPNPLSHLSTLLSHLPLSLPSLLSPSARIKPSNSTQTRCATAHRLQSSIIIFEI
jgi:hypothetical protein